MTGKVWQLALLALGGLLAAAGPALADIEYREFDVQVDGKHAGQSTVSIAQQQDGSVLVNAQVEVKVKQLLATYSYSYQGSELWQAGKLVALSSKSDDNGKRFEVTARANPNGLRVVVNNKEHLARLETWTTSFWKLADPKFHNQAVPILEVDTGKEIDGRLLYVGAEQMKVAGKDAQCYHFRVTGGANPVELWFDVQQRLVRHESIEDGHRMVVQLTSIRK